jgi:hypothetical protein
VVFKVAHLLHLRAFRDHQIDSQILCALRAHDTTDTFSVFGATSCLIQYYIFNNLEWFLFFFFARTLAAESNNEMLTEGHLGTSDAANTQRRWSYRQRLGPVKYYAAISSYSHLEKEAGQNSIGKLVMVAI